MKRSLLLLIVVFSFLRAQSQCVVTHTVQNMTCDTVTCSGVVIFSVSGGSFPYELTINGMPPITLWNNFYTLGNMCPGAYTYSVTDSSGAICTGPTTFIIQTAQPPTFQLQWVNATCTSCCDGAILPVNVTGGTPPYSYQWSNGANTLSINNLCPGIYILYVIDANGCMAQDTAWIGIGNNGYYTLTGRIFQDLDGNGVQDVNETGLSNKEVTLYPGGDNALSNGTGDYMFIVAPGNYQLVYSPNNTNWQTLTGPAQYNPVVSTFSIDSLDFSVQADSNYTEASVLLNNMTPRCNMVRNFYVNIYNSGTLPVSGNVEYTYDPVIAFQNSYPSPSSTGTNSVTIPFSNVQAGGTYQITIQFLMPNPGITFQNSASVFLSDYLGNPVDTLTAVTGQITVTCSCDPNDKSGPEAYEKPNEFLNYLIRFQNTGTDTAYKVVIIDTLDTNFNLNSFNVIAASHLLNTTISTDRVVTFTFDNIMLPDSNVNEPLSHGYVLYRVKNNPGLPDPTMVSNTAYIYFDSNSAVQTNLLETTLTNNITGLSNFVVDNDFVLFPNPTKSGSILIAGKTHQGTLQVSVLDILGKEVFSTRGVVGSVQLPAEKLSKGIYSIKISSQGSKDITTLKWVVQ